MEDGVIKIIVFRLKNDWEKGTQIIDPYFNGILNPLNLWLYIV